MYWFFSRVERGHEQIVLLLRSSVNGIKVEVIDSYYINAKTLTECKYEMLKNIGNLVISEISSIKNAGRLNVYLYQAIFAVSR
jgi:hypothetical protein